MGKSGPIAQQPSRQLEAPPVDTPIPPYPEGILKSTGQRWDALWRSPMNAVLLEIHLPALHRLFRYYDEWTRTERDYRRAVRQGDQLVDGSRGQLVMNPLAGRLIELETNILRLEDKLGLNPMAAARLGLTMAATQLTWQSVQRGGAALPAGDTGVIDVDEVLELPA